MKQPSRTYQDSLRDMLEAATLAIRFVKGLHLNQFEANVEKQFAVVRALEIIGEAARQIPVDVHACYPDIPWSDMIGMRNLVIHAYFGVDLEVIWRTVQEDLPVGLFHVDKAPMKRKESCKLWQKWRKALGM